MGTGSQAPGSGELHKFAFPRWESHSVHVAETMSAGWLLWACTEFSLPFFAAPSSKATAVFGYCSP